jgi:anion-transporting  ArsA/GET3 family ATPase
MRIYAIANQKGGVGKTATTVNLAAALAEAGRRVLIIDWDPQGHLTDALGVNHDPVAGACLPRALLGQWQGELGELVRQVAPNLYVIPTSDEMFLLEPQMYGRTGREYLLTRFVDALAGAFDDVLIDCPPSLGALNYKRERKAVLAQIEALGGVDQNNVAWLNQWVSSIGSYELAYRLQQIVEEDLPTALRTRIQTRTETLPTVLHGIVDNAPNVWAVMATARNRIAHGDSQPTPEQLLALARLGTQWPPGWRCSSSVFLTPS